MSIRTSFGVKQNPCGSVEVAGRVFTFLTALRRPPSVAKRLQAILASSDHSDDQREGESDEDFQARVRAGWVGVIVTVLGEESRSIVDDPENFPLGELAALWRRIQISDEEAERQDPLFRSRPGAAQPSEDGSSGIGLSLA